MTKTTSSLKTSCRTLECPTASFLATGGFKFLIFQNACMVFRQLVFWLLMVSSFNYFKMHAWSTSMLLLLLSAFMLSMVKLLLKGEVGVCALNSHGNYIVDRGKSWTNHGLCC